MVSLLFSVGQSSREKKKPEALRLGLDFFGYGCILR